MMSWVGVAIRRRELGVVTGCGGGENKEPAAWARGLV
jgi:hypothetical protein